MPSTAHAPLLLLHLDDDTIALVLSALKDGLLDTLAVCGASKRLRLIHFQLHPFSFLFFNQFPDTPVVRLDFTRATGAGCALNIKVQQVCFGSLARRERARHADLRTVVSHLFFNVDHFCTRFDWLPRTDECARARHTAKQCTDEMETHDTDESTTRRARAALDALRALHLLLFGPSSNQHAGTLQTLRQWGDGVVTTGLRLVERMLQLEMTSRPFVSVAEYLATGNDCKRLRARVRGKSTQACHVKLDGGAHLVPLSPAKLFTDHPKRAFHCEAACFWTDAAGGHESRESDSTRHSVVFDRAMCDKVTFMRAAAQGADAELIGVQFPGRDAQPVFLPAERLRALLS